MQTVEAIHAQQLNDVGGGNFTVTYPSNADTVLSVQPDGSIQTRPHGTAGPYELCRINGGFVAFRPAGVKASAYILPFAQDCPNG